MDGYSLWLLKINISGTLNRKIELKYTVKWFSSAVNNVPHYGQIDLNRTDSAVPQNYLISNINQSFFHRVLPDYHTKSTILCNRFPEFRGLCNAELIWKLEHGRGFIWKTEIKDINCSSHDAHPCKLRTRIYGFKIYRIGTNPRQAVVHRIKRNTLLLILHFILITPSMGSSSQFKSCTAFRRRLISWFNGVVHRIKWNTLLLILQII